MKKLPDLYRKKEGSLTVRGGNTPEGAPSIILSMPHVDKKIKTLVVLKIDGAFKLNLIKECIDFVLMNSEA